MIRFLLSVAAGILAVFVVGNLLGLLMPVLTHPVATVLFIAVGALFVSRLMKAGAR